MATSAVSEKDSRFQKVENSQKQHQNFNQTMDYYKTWVKSYEEDLDVVGYQAPMLAADYLANIGLPKDIKILDTACGTGLCAIILRDKHGYTNMDGLDASDDMLAIATERNIYNKIFNCKIGDGNVMPIEDNSYDAVTMAGGLVSGHIKLDAFKDIARITKQGGYVVISMREENRREVNEYKEQDKVFAAYEQEGLWKKISETVTKNYYMNYDGLVLVYQVTQH